MGIRGSAVRCASYAASLIAPPASTILVDELDSGGFKNAYDRAWHYK
jgi:hypothetical protein